eukprot:CAMPEP_0197533866 /NCGR_PEP_ID=MMETSP1318-20131121/44953_1 /TAXON_ID=552666 /ORGANISM="Partenskyella glossopodia, Strain RCC365" /LENGTH=286 /DNA_ID=CAMNT_0043090907 /DNA_START=117 /DNA_END=977 /DNA_ORIENTATION=-
MSFQDMATDARQKYVELWENSGHMLPEGFLMASKRILREFRENSTITRFLNEHKDYGVVFTGHSLGGSASIVCTLLLKHDQTWSRSVRAYAVGPAPCITHQLGKKDAWKEIIFSAVFRDDVVPRMCLQSLFRLRSQALAAFRRCSHPAEHVFQDFKDLQSMEEISIYQTADFPHVERRHYDEKSVPPLLIPGKIFHILGSPLGKRAIRCLPCLRSPLRHSSCTPQMRYSTVAYSACSSTFSEIRVTANMLLDHFPHRYLNALNGIKFPEEFCDDWDDAFERGRCYL